MHVNFESLARPLVILTVLFLEAGAQAASPQARLRRAPFDIILYVSDDAGPYVNASFERRLYEIARRQMPLGPYFRVGTTVAEAEFNPDKDAVVSDDANHYWGYPGGFVKFEMREGGRIVDRTWVTAWEAKK